MMTVTTMTLPRLRLREILLTALSLAMTVVVVDLTVALISLQEEAMSPRSTVVVPVTIHHDHQDTKPMRTEAPAAAKIWVSLPPP